VAFAVFANFGGCKLKRFPATFSSGTLCVQATAATVRTSPGRRCELHTCRLRAMVVGCVDSDSMSVVLWLLFVGFIRAQLPSQQQPQNVYIGYDQLYSSGIVAYDQQHWFECSSLMGRAVGARRAYWDGVAECRSHCAARHTFADIAADNPLDPLYVYRASQRSKCIDDCRRLKFGGQADVPFDAELEEAFNSLMPYDYLQMCAYQVNIFQMVVSML